jgi:glycine cleavage system regulatory protein
MRVVYQFVATDQSARVEQGLAALAAEHGLDYMLRRASERRRVLILVAFD